MPPSFLVGANINRNPSLRLFPYPWSSSFWLEPLFSVSHFLWVVERERERERERAMEEARGGEEITNEISKSEGCCSGISVHFIQKIIAEILGTYFLIFAGCGVVAVDLSKGGAVTFPGVCTVWGLTVMVVVYSVGHISGAHINPAITIAFASCGRFPWKQVPMYIIAQLVGSTLASGTVRLLFGGGHNRFFGTIPTGSNVQSLVLEFIITFFLMFVLAGVATDNRAADIRTVDESREDPGECDRVAPVHRNLGVHGGPHCRGGRWSMGLQSHPVHQQAPPGDHQEWVIPQNPEKRIRI
ncbi:aquaporin NIP1-1-like isoform X2 [Ananas comosus]|uniref:Aquaporin NIP1-1-like isoform X2 n=1 Tax=Ananas comosus TaxID=4615 RepID=A0A6P5FE29_ANACO|nr:aquaporin NIP1-1-like isoform X2 [Ananas comosus]